MPLGNAKNSDTRKSNRLVDCGLKRHQCFHHEIRQLQEMDLVIVWEIAAFATPALVCHLICPADSSPDKESPKRERDIRVRWISARRRMSGSGVCPRRQ